MESSQLLADHRYSRRSRVMRSFSKSGYLVVKDKKKARGSKKRRWFVLSKSILTYYATGMVRRPTCASNSTRLARNLPLGARTQGSKVVDSLDIKGGTIQATDSAKKKLSFAVEASKRTLHLKASSIAEKEEWVAALKIAASTSKTFSLMAGDEGRAKLRVQLDSEEHVESILITRSTTVGDSVRMIHRQLALGQRNDNQMQQIRRAYAYHSLFVVQSDGTAVELADPDQLLWDSVSKGSVALVFRLTTAAQRSLAFASATSSGSSSPGLQKALSSPSSSTLSLLTASLPQSSPPLVPNATTLLTPPPPATSAPPIPTSPTRASPLSSSFAPSPSSSWLAARTHESHSPSTSLLGAPSPISAADATSTVAAGWKSSHHRTDTSRRRSVRLRALGSGTESDDSDDASSTSQ